LSLDILGRKETGEDSAEGNTPMRPGEARRLMVLAAEERILDQTTASV